MSAVTVPPPSALADRDPARRAAQARAVLARAEERTGAQRWVRPVLPAVVAPQPDVPDADEAPVALTRSQLVEPAATARLLPVEGALTGLLPRGGLERGSTVVVAGSTSLALALLIEASQAGGWVALVGLPTVGVLAAHQLGLDLARTILVPSPGPDGPTAVAALLDGVDVVVVGPGAALAPADQRRLSARARERSAVLLPTSPWPGAHVVLTAEGSRWEGLGRGHGRLRSRRLVVRRGGRGMSAQEHRSEITLPASPPSWTEEVPTGSGTHLTEVLPASGDDAGRAAASAAAAGAAAGPVGAGTAAADVAGGSTSAAGPAAGPAAGRAAAHPPVGLWDLDGRRAG